MLKEAVDAGKQDLFVFQEQSFLERQKFSSRENIRNFIVNSTIKYNAKGPFIDVACGYRTSKPEVGKVLRKLDNYIAFDLFNLTDRVEEVNAMQNLQANAQNIPLDTNCAETLICVEALEHISDDIESMKEMRRILKGGGLLILSVPGIDVPAHEKNYQKDYRRYTKDQILSLLANNNFKPMEYEEKYFESKHINTFIVAR